MACMSADGVTPLPYPCEVNALMTYLSLAIIFGFALIVFAIVRDLLRG